MNSKDEFISRAKRLIDENTSAGDFYTLVMDITDFHTINHIYGGKDGDVLLDRMKTVFSKLPNICLCTRVFADLFHCLMFVAKGEDVSNCLKMNDSVIQSFLDEWRSNYPACNLKVACGACKIDGVNLPWAIDSANTARKAAKKAITTKTVLYDDDMKNRVANRYDTAKESYYALLEGRMCFYLQPKIDLTNGEIIGAEALARRIGKDGEIIYPDAFLETMESSGAIIELDRSICRQVCGFLAGRIEKGLPVICISVNLSRLHIQEPEAAEKLHNIVTEYNTPPELLEFEMTETILVEEFSGAKQFIDQLRGYGYRVSIDDFGSGYAGITIWQELSFDCLKLDRKFLADSQFLKERNEALVPNIINIAQRLHVQVLCEGVETEEQCRYLMKLGCTLVQGFYFAEPVPPDELLSLYELQDGKYPLPPSLEPKTVKGESVPEKKTKERIFRGQHMLTVALCAVFLVLCVVGVLVSLRELTQNEFYGIVSETLDAYTDGQREKTQTEISGIISMLELMAVQISGNDDTEFIDTYLLALDEYSTEVKYQYISRDDYLKSLNDGSVSESTVKKLEQLMNGETIVSDIIFSERFDNTYCIGLGVPVMRDGEFIGAVRGVINAEKLVSTHMYDPTQGEIVTVFLTDGDSRILPIRKDGGKAVGELLTERVKNWNADDGVVEQIKSAFESNDLHARSVRVGVYDGVPYYLAMTGLGYNDWHLVVCLKADKALAHSNHIVRNTAAGIFVLIIAVALSTLCIYLFIWRMQQRFSLEQRRYLLLERFSDTVLFDYNCRRDTVRFTPNAVKLMRVHEMTQKGFLRNLDKMYLYAGDQEEIRRMLSGQFGAESGEMRIRLMRPDSDTYFWCLVQYKYLFERGTPVAVIGKITDIDEHTRNEEQLLRMSETDGLTGLLNKATTEKLVSERLTQTQNGILMVIDVDDFKKINDEYGHAAGDLALHFIGDCIQRTFRTDDVMGRIGGDEMLVFVSKLNSMEIAQKKADLLVRHLEMRTDPNISPLTVSIGIAIAPEDGVNFSDLFGAADKAMYAAKQNGKRQICFYSDISK